MTITNRTFCDLLRNKMSLRVHCLARGCGANTELDVAKLAFHLGCQHGAMAKDLEHRLRCKKCGQKGNVKLTLFPGDLPGG